MAMYEFVCESCGEVVEVIQHYEDEPPKCDHCDLTMKRVLSGGHITLDFKGECWAKDGYTKRTKNDHS